MEVSEREGLTGFRPGEEFDAEAERTARSLVDLAIDEDLPAGDPTSDALFPPSARLGLEAAIVAREAGVACGRPVVDVLFARLDPLVCVESILAEGADMPVGASWIRLRGPAASVLRGERIALNFLQRLAGIATRARRWVAEVRGTRARLLDTRKTTPGWRALEKYAVRTGGAWNHRRSLSAAAMIKDNHAWLLREEGDGDVASWVDRIRRRTPGLAVEVEVDTREEFLGARDAGADVILLDNFSPEDLIWAVEENRRRPEPRPLLEASGGIGGGAIAPVAATGVDRISSGSMVYAAPPLDLSLEAIGRYDLAVS